MQNLLKILLRYSNFLVFIVLEVAAFLLIGFNNPYPRSSLLSTANDAVAWQHETVSEINGYFSLRHQNELLAQEEDFALAHSALAVIYGKVNRHEDAVKHGRRVCEIEPKEAFSFTAMSVTFQRAYAGTGNMQYIQLAEDAMARSRLIQG
jgi:hypothetical protein